MISIPGLILFAGLTLLFLKLWKTSKATAFLMASVMGTVIMAITVIQTHAGPGAFFTVVVVGGFFSLVSFVVDRAVRNGKDAREWLEKTPNATLRHRSSKTGVAVDPVAKKLFLKQDSIIRAYDFSDVRGWKKEWLTGGGVYAAGGGLGGSLAVLGANNAARAQNRAGSGLFVEVRDMEHPVFHIQFESGKELNQWYEILIQHINEGV